MPWRLIIFIVIFAIFLAFITFNLENKCNISFGFTALRDVPVFITIFSSFSLGLICAFPLVMHIKHKHKEPKHEKKAEKEPVIDCTAKPIDPKAARKKFFLRKRGSDAD
jgi:uncharacterized integral membrane protein